jgi:hypothetical protein
MARKASLYAPTKSRALIQNKVFGQPVKSRISWKQ